MADGRSDDHEFIRGETRDGQVGFDAAVLIQPLRVDDAARGNIDVRARQTVQEGASVFTLHEEFREAGLVEQGDGIAHCEAFFAAVVEPVLAAIAVFVLRVGARRGIPVRAFPTSGLTHAGARGHETVVQRRAARATRGLVLVVRPVHGVQQAQRFHGAVVQIALVALEVHGATNVDISQVHRRATVANPFRQHLAGTTTRGNTHRVEARGHEQILHFRRFAHVIAIVGGEAFRAIEEQLNAGVCQLRHATHGVVQNRFEVVVVFRQRVEAEVLRDALHAPRLGHRLEAAHENLAGIFLVVRAFVLHAQHRQVRRHAFQRLGHDVKVFGGVQRHRYAGFTR